MKKSSAPHPYQSSRFADPNADSPKDNKGMARSNVTEKRVAAAAAHPSKLEKKPSVDINESAEAFIQKFRHQLLLQRLDSIENYEKMLARGL
ncbi:hypothetical protein V6N13_132916 [Hibiscus sabdariffa]